MLDHSDGSSCLVCPPGCPATLTFKDGKQMLTLPPVPGIKPYYSFILCACSAAWKFVFKLRTEDVELDCDTVARTGQGMVKWWELLTTNAVQNKYESWALQWLSVVRG